MLSANPPQLWIRHAGKINTQTDAKGWSKVLQSNLECLGMEEVASSIQCQSNGGFLPSPPVPINAAWGQSTWLMRKAYQEHPLFQNPQTKAKLLF